jgi:hypothetical protein
MADIQHDYSNWAARKAGKEAPGEEGGQPGEGQEDGQGEQEPPPPAHECVSHAAQELTEAIEMLEKAKGQVEEPDALQKVIDELTVQQQDLSEQAKELEEAAAEDEDDEDEEDATPGPEAV